MGPVVFKNNFMDVIGEMGFIGSIYLDESSAPLKITINKTLFMKRYSCQNIFSLYITRDDLPQHHGRGLNPGLPIEGRSLYHIFQPPGDQVKII